MSKNTKDNKEFIFKVGDKVKVPWSDEVFTLEGNSGLDIYPLRIDCGQQGYEAFTKDGKYEHAQEKPILTLIERPKKYKKITKEVYANVYDGDVIFHEHEVAARSKQCEDVLNPTNKLVKITYYVEVEDDE